MALGYVRDIFSNTRLIVLIAHGNGYDAIDPADIVESSDGFVSLFTVFSVMFSNGKFCFLRPQGSPKKKIGERDI